VTGGPQLTLTDTAQYTHSSVLLVLCCYYITSPTRHDGMSGFGLPPPTTHHYPPQFNNSSSSNNQLPPPRLPPTAAHSHSSSSMRPAPTYRYELEIAQQPIRARMCGIFPPFPRFFLVSDPNVPKLTIS